MNTSKESTMTSTERPLTGEIITDTIAVAMCASEDCGYPLTRNADGTDRYGDTEPFEHGCHYGCYVPTKAEMMAAGNWPTADNWDTFHVAAPNAKRVR